VTATHYSEFAFKKIKSIFKMVSIKEQGGFLYFEWFLPDLIVLEDLITIFHPELLPNHKLFSSEIRIN
jgi:iron complex transport system substrate-binding protein